MVNRLGLAEGTEYMEQNQPYTYEKNTFNNQQNPNGTTVNYGQTNYNNPPVFYVNGKFVKPEPQHGPVNDIFCRIVMVILIVQQFRSLFASKTVCEAILRNCGYDSSIVTMLIRGHQAMVILGYLLFIAMVVCFFLDILSIQKQHYKVTGLVLFAFLLMLGYFIWRAHVLGRKKKYAVIYTVCYVLILLGNILIHIVLKTNAFKTIYWLLV